MTEEMLTPRPVRDSQSEMAELVLPNDANPLGALLGRPADALDRSGRSDGRSSPRAQLRGDSFGRSHRFSGPGAGGDLVILRSSVNRVFQTSMEVGVKVFVENYIADTAQHVASAYLTFVAVDAQGQPPESRRR